jgi:hypothetical protein
MAMTRYFLIGALTAAALVPMQMADAANKKGAAGGAELPKSTVAPLTVSECQRLGGEVYANPDCNKTGKSCHVRTLGSGEHWVCINEAG